MVFVAEIVHTLHEVCSFATQAVRARTVVSVFLLFVFCSSFIMIFLLVSYSMLCFAFDFMWAVRKMECKLTDDFFVLIPRNVRAMRTI